MIFSENRYPPRIKSGAGFFRDHALGPVGIQDSHPSLIVIQAVDGPIRFD
jgi:hypothetical protein